MGLRADAGAFLIAVAECRRAGISSIDYERDGSVARVEFYPASDTERAPPPDTLRNPVIPPPPGVPRDSETRLIDARLTVYDPHPEFIGEETDDQTVAELVAREREWLATNGGSQ